MKKWSVQGRKNDKCTKKLKLLSRNNQDIKNKPSSLWRFLKIKNPKLTAVALNRGFTYQSEPLLQRTMCLVVSRKF